MPGRTWKDIKGSVAEKIKAFLLDNGGSEERIKGQYEVWRIKFSDSTFTFYKTGSLFSTFSNSKDPSVFEAWREIDSLVEITYVLPDKDFLIGLDETGKGEVIGHMVLTGVIFPKEIFEKINLVVGPSDTKKRHKFEYWDEIFKNLDCLRKEGFDFINEKIPPWQIDRFNLNKIMDVTYQRILNIFFRKIQIAQSRIVLDDYGIGPTLKRFLNFLKKQGAQIVVVKRAEDRYLEVRTASLISKRMREAVLKSINENLEYKVDTLSVGSGNAGDSQTVKWIEKWYESGKGWPWFVKRSFRNIRALEGKAGKQRKIEPPIEEGLLSSKFLEDFNKGYLSIQSLSIVCPSCGSILKGASIAIFEENKHRRSELKCPDCDKLIRNSGYTLRYYCGYILPDSSVILRNLISNDLNASRFFEDFTILLAPVVRKECDQTQRGKREFEKLWKYNSMGRIRLESVGKVEDIPDNLSGTIRDERIIETCLEYNAMLLTADRAMSAFAVGKGVFTIIA